MKTHDHTMPKPSDDGTNIGESSQCGTETAGNNVECSKPRPTPPEKIKIEDLTLVLVPRIKFNFIFGCTEGFYGRLVSETTLKSMVIAAFMNPYIFVNPLIIPRDDVKVRYLVPPKRTDDDNDMLVVAEGCLFVREPKFAYKELVVKGREILLRKVGTFRTSYFGTKYKIRLSVPPSEDPDKMMASVSKTSQMHNLGPSHEPPTIIIKGFPSQWFAEQSDSSEPSKRLLRIFLESFGNVREFDVVEDGVSVQYEDCYKALESLCACSLQKEGGSETVDYLVTWKEQEMQVVSEEDDPRACRNKRTLEDDHTVCRNNKSFKQRVEAIKLHATKIEEELKVSMASLGALGRHFGELQEELSELSSLVGC